MKTAKIISIFVVVILLYACSNKKNFPKPEVLIDQEVMVDIITDLYLTDGLLNISKVRQSFEQKDSIEAYIDVINSYGFTKNDFDSNLDYYFISKPEKFTLIYEAVVVKLSEMEDENTRKRESDLSLTKNIWNQKTSFRLPEDATTNPIDFSIPLTGIGKYDLKVRATIFEDDQSVDLATNIYFWYDDGSESGVRLPWENHIYKKTARSELVNLSMNLTDDRYTHLKGSLLGHTKQSGHWEMHSSISGISITFRPTARRLDPEIIRGIMKRFSAQYIFTATGKILKRGIITTSDEGLIIDIEYTGGNLPERSSTEFYNGIIVPGFVNCHSHLELSDMKGVIDRGTGLGGFIRGVSENRNPYEAVTKKSIKEADTFLYSTGTSAVADICNTSLSFETKDNSKIKYVNLLEVFGADPQKSRIRIEAIKALMLEASMHKSPSYFVPHSVYSISEPLFEDLKSLTNSSKLTSIHFLESEQERMLLNDLSGPMMESFSKMGITHKMIQNRVRGHLEAIKKYIPDATALILVHNTYVHEAEIKILTKRPDTWWCLCPKSNLYIEDSLPPVELLLSYGAKIVIGSDSLASTDSLNILDDLILLQNKFPKLSLNQLIEWSSANGARVLNMTSLGTIEKGKTPGLVLIENCNLKELKLTSQSKSRRLI